jgi:hypothetical protein
MRMRHTKHMVTVLIPHFPLHISVIMNHHEMGIQFKSYSILSRRLSMFSCITTHINRRCESFEGFQNIYFLKNGQN